MDTKLCCPTCGRPVLVDATGECEALPTASGSVYLHSGTCPYPSCAATVHAWTDAPEAFPDVLLSVEEMKMLRLRCAFSAVAPVLIAWISTFGMLLVSVWAAAQGLAAESAAAVALVIGGPVMVVACVSGFVGLAVASGEVRSKLRFEVPLRLVPVPLTYRA
jgi:hypothetical protein